MIEPKKKKCKGTGKCKDYGCGYPNYIHRYGLCEKCFINWLLNTKEGHEVIQKGHIKAVPR